MKNRDSAVKVMIGLREVAGYANNLRKGFDSLGIKCTQINIFDHAFQYSNKPDDNAFIRFKRKTYGKKKEAGNSFFKALWRCADVLSSVVLFVWCLLHFNTFIFFYNSTFFHFYDLPVLKFFKKKIIYVFLGSDSRPPYLSGAIMQENGTRTIKSCIKLAAKIKNKINVIEKYADVCVNFYSQAHFHTRPFINGLVIGIPYKPHNPEIQAVLTGVALGKDTVRILHAPSKTGPKGTEKIRAMIHELKEEGLRIDYVEIAGKPNNEVVRELQLCDFVVDQLYSDTPLAVFATEAAWFSKPAVVGGYYADQIKDDVPPEYIPPGIFCLPDEFKAKVKSLVQDRNVRLKTGSAVGQFVRTNWAAEAVAQRYVSMISGNIPNEWIGDPYKNGYVYGMGIEKSRLRALLKSVLDEGGIKTLQLKDKPELERAISEFAYSAVG